MISFMLIRDIISNRLVKAIQDAQHRGAIQSDIEIPDTGLIERPQKSENGDFASSFPLRVAKSLKKAPMEIAQTIADAFEIGGCIGEIFVAPPGFINFKLSSAWLQLQIEEICNQPEVFGNTDTGEGRTVQVEFVSVNPTGPVHVGHARGAVLGSALANALSAAGFNVTREYYVNDAGTQMELFYSSTFARYAQARGRKEFDIPENGYQGAYLVELGEKLAEQYESKYLEMDEQKAISELGEEALNLMLRVIRKDLEQIGVNFDVWFREKTLYEDGKYEATINYLRARGLTDVHDGAEWFTSTALGDEKDNVIIRTSGAPTYFASDIAYHRDKFLERKFDYVINIWGADHQGHVPRMKAVMKALELDPDRLTILIAQLVTLKSGGDIVRASKRTGQIVTLADLVEEVGADACRYFFLARAAESQMEFDLELAKRESSENPVFYVQYAHARISSILQQACDRGIVWSDGDTSLLNDDAELQLLKKMLQLPEIIDTIAITLAPHALPHYSVELATAFHGFYDHCRVLSNDPDEEPIMKARLKLVESAKIALSRTLDLMGMSAPEKM
ncbi:MAG: arginine--tRNA ligase [SAR202 cluster bacterium]|nr:arginine--tRNA ligase [SAR202 cluster bacterium]